MTLWRSRSILNRDSQGSPDRCNKRGQLFSGGARAVNKRTGEFVSSVGMIFIFGIVKKVAVFVEKSQIVVSEVRHKHFRDGFFEDLPMKMSTHQ